MRDQEWRDLLAGVPMVRPWELWLQVTGAPDLSRYNAVDRAVYEYALTCMGYKKQAVHPLQLDVDRFVWVREPWESDAEWEDLSDDPVWRAVMERYVASRVAQARVPR